ncbi:ankyrin repeat domain-containing protein 50-like, partial [Haliotis rubra]|uniref:ankyrin repeat domain-containing protein 50-like n=1 Tax=Haliotis rubra TaxID=36100 RepID=UPI001EE5DE24
DCPTDYWTSQPGNKQRLKFSARLQSSPPPLSSSSSTSYPPPRDIVRIVTHPVGYVASKLASSTVETDGTHTERPPEQKVNQKEASANSPLHDACKKGDLGRVRHILSRGLVDINSRDDTKGRTPLMVAALKRHSRIVEFLLRKGANVSHVDTNGDDVLYWACSGGHDIVDINSRGRYGRTPLMTAAYYGQREAFDVLVSSGCRTDLVEDQGHTILHLACLGGRMEMAEHILKQNMADINARDKAGKTAAMIANHEGQRSCFKCLS